MSDLYDPSAYTYRGRPFQPGRCKCVEGYSADPDDHVNNDCPAWRGLAVFQMLVDRAESDRPHISGIRAEDILSMLPPAGPADPGEVHDLTIAGPAVSAKNARRVVYSPSGVPFIAPDLRVKKWMKGAILQLVAQWSPKPPLTGSLEVGAVVVLGPRQRLDIDNAIGGVLDALERAGVIKSDNLIMRLTATKIKTDRKNPRVEIQVRDMLTSVGYLR